MQFRRSCYEVCKLTIQCRSAPVDLQTLFEIFNNNIIKKVLIFFYTNGNGETQETVSVLYSRPTVLLLSELSDF